MPHSSGGGSHGGGSHGGSHGGGGSSGPRMSRHYYPGARTFVYYRHGMPMYIYSDVDPRSPAYRRSKILSAIFLIPFILILGFMLYSMIQPPTKLNTSYDVAIYDNIEVLGDTSELETALNDFKDTTGITPAVMTVYNEKWESRYNSLEDYAYDAYVNNFSDETHWLIVYSQPTTPDEDYIDWYWEGMMGDETGSILTDSVLDEFNADLQKYLTANSRYTVSEAIAAAFNDITPTIMEQHVGFSDIAPIALMLLIVIGIFFGIIFGDRLRGISPENLTEVSGPAASSSTTSSKPKTAKCEYCGGEYVVGAHTRCPHCGATLTETTDGTQY